MSWTCWWTAASLPMSAATWAGAVGATGTRTVTRTLASVVPPSPFAVRWKLVELDGDTVWVPLRLTSPMPSMVTAVAFWLRQLRTTDWPRSMASGSAVIVAVGAAGGVAAGPREAGFTPLAFLWQPVTAPSAMKVATRTKVLRDLICTAIIEYLLLSLVFQTINVPCAAISQGRQPLLPTPVWHVGAGAGQSAFLRAVGEHGHD